MRALLVAAAVVCMSVGQAQADVLRDLSWSSERYSLSCSVEGPGGRWKYLLIVDDPLHYEWYWTSLHKPIVRLQTEDGAPLVMVVDRFDADVVKARLQERLTNWPAEATQMVFEIKRSDGSVSVMLLGAEHGDPKTGKQWWLSIMQEVGTCSKAPPAF